MLTTMFFFLALKFVFLKEDKNEEAPFSFELPVQVTGSETSDQD
jgi:hypothetical protein